MVAAAYPFVEVRIDTSALAPVAQRSPGVIAVVGRADAGAAPANVPRVVGSRAEAAALFATINADDTVTPTPLFSSLETALLQDPRPSKIYGVKVDGDNDAAALAALEAVDDVTFVALANEVTVGEAAGPNPATGLMALKAHVENMSAAGQKRIGVAMIDPAIPKTDDYVATVTAAIANLRSDVSRMVLIAARGAAGDAAVAAMAAMAGFEPHISMVLKRIRGVRMPLENQYGATEIRALSEANINPIIDPTLIVGEGLHLAEGRTFTTDATLLYIDIVRTLDDIDFRLKAGLIGLIGDARITKAGMTLLRLRVEGILGPLARRAVIADFSVEIPVLNVLNLPESTWTPADRALVETARQNRTVDLLVTVTYGPAVHRLVVTLAPKF